MQATGSASLTWLSSVTGNYFILAVIAIGMSLLLVSEISLIALKFRNLKIAENKPQFILLAFALLAFVLFTFAALPLIILAYILISLIFKPVS